MSRPRRDSSPSGNGRSRTPSRPPTPSGRGNGQLRPPSTGRGDIYGAAAQELDGVPVGRLISPLSSAPTSSASSTASSTRHPLDTSNPRLRMHHPMVPTRRWPSPGPPRAMSPHTPLVVGEPTPPPSRAPSSRAPSPAQGRHPVPRPTSPGAVALASAARIARSTSPTPSSGSSYATPSSGRGPLPPSDPFRTTPQPPAGPSSKAKGKARARTPTPTTPPQPQASGSGTRRPSSDARTGPDVQVRAPTPGPAPRARAPSPGPSGGYLFPPQGNLPRSRTPASSMGSSSYGSSSYAPSSYGSSSVFSSDGYGSSDPTVPTPAGARRWQPVRAPTPGPSAFQTGYPWPNDRPPAHAATPAPRPASFRPRRDSNPGPMPSAHIREGGRLRDLEEERRQAAQQQAQRPTQQYAPQAGPSVPGPRRPGMGAHNDPRARLRPPPGPPSSSTSSSSRPSARDPSFDGPAGPSVHGYVPDAPSPPPPYETGRPSTGGSGSVQTDAELERDLVDCWGSRRTAEIVQQFVTPNRTPSSSSTRSRRASTGQMGVAGPSNIAGQQPAYRAEWYVPDGGQPTPQPEPEQLPNYYAEWVDPDDPGPDGGDYDGSLPGYEQGDGPDYYFG